MLIYVFKPMSSLSLMSTEEMITATKPAILGSRATFESTLRLVIPDLPSYSSMQSEFSDIVDSGVLTKGRHLQQFEKSAAKHCGSNFAVGVSSCTTGLVLAHKALELHGEVILPSFTFLASALGCAWNNTVPVFVDIDADDWTINPKAVEAAIMSKTTGIVATHVFGNPCQIDQLEEIAKRHGIKLIFDAAHGFGALYQGKALGSRGDLEVFSLSPTKLVIAGEGGMITFNDEKLRDKLQVLREYGNDGQYDLIDSGLNARMPEINALLGNEGLKRLEGVVERRTKVATDVIEHLKNVPGIKWQQVRSGNRSSLKDLAMLVEEKTFGMSRDMLAKTLAAENIETRNYYDPPCHRQSYWQERCRVNGTLTVTEQLSNGALTIPLHSKMTDQDVAQLAGAITAAHKYASEIRKAIG